MKPKISALVAMAENRVIGSQNKLPWHLPEDLKRFRALTTGHSIVMGRKTFESIGRPLPNRKNILITRDPNLRIPGVLCVTSLDEALELAGKDQDEIFIIGGSEIYKLSFSRITRLYLTLIHREVSGDAFFPEFDWNEFEEISRETHQGHVLTGSSSEDTSYSFIVLERKK